MYEQLFEADLVIADLSTANPNAFFELGVRYALKPRTTIVISEKGFKIPFDMGQVIVRSYEHLGDGIDFGEVERMREELMTACKEVAAANRVDSPVYTFLTRLTPPELKKLVDAAEHAAQAHTKQALGRSHRRKRKSGADGIICGPDGVGDEGARRAELQESPCHSQRYQGCPGRPGRSLCRSAAGAVYLQVKGPGATRRASASANHPRGNLAQRTPGIPRHWASGARFTNGFPRSANTPEERRGALDEAVWAYEKGFYLKDDHYNGINYAFLLNVRAAQSSGEDAIADRVQAQRVRQRVLRMCEEQLASGIKGESKRSKAEQEVLGASNGRRGTLRTGASCRIRRRLHSGKADESRHRRNGWSSRRRSSSANSRRCCHNKPVNASDS